MRNNPERLLDLEELATFVAVATAGSFTAASTARGIPRATATRHVAQLEQSLGVRLLARTTRAMKLTPAGADLLERARRILDEVRAARDSASEREGLVSGVVRVSAPVELGAEFLAPVVAEFARVHPDIQVQVELTSRRVDLVEERVDVAVRVGDLADSGLVARHLGDVEFWLCAAPSYLSARGEPASPEALAGLEILAFREHADRNTWLLRSGRRAVKVTPREGRIEANSFALLRRAAEGGLGLVRLPRFVADDAVRAGRLVRVLAGWQLPSLPVHALVTTALLLPRRTRLFLDALASEFTLRASPPRRP